MSFTFAWLSCFIGCGFYACFLLRFGFGFKMLLKHYCLVLIRHSCLVRVGLPKKKKKILVTVIEIEISVRWQSAACAFRNTDRMKTTEVMRSELANRSTKIRIQVKRNLKHSVIRRLIWSWFGYIPLGTLELPRVTQGQ